MSRFSNPPGDQSLSTVKKYSQSQPTVSFTLRYIRLPTLFFSQRCLSVSVQFLYLFKSCFLLLFFPSSLFLRAICLPTCFFKQPDMLQEVYIVENQGELKKKKKKRNWKQECCFHFNNPYAWFVNVIRIAARKKMKKKSARRDTR